MQARVEEKRERTMLQAANRWHRSSARWVCLSLVTALPIADLPLTEIIHQRTVHQ